MKRVLFGGFLTSLTYLGYKAYSHIREDEEEDSENYLILKRMREARSCGSGYLKDTPFPVYLEVERSLLGRIPPTTNSDSSSLCESIQNQLQRDWNHFIYKLIQILL